MSPGHHKKAGFALFHNLIFSAATVIIAFLCIRTGSVELSLSELLAALSAMLKGVSLPTVAYAILSVRLPRVLLAALVGAALSLCGGAMQGLLRNPLADGSTLGVSSGASLGAVLAIAFGSRLSVLSGVGTTAMAVIFAFLSLVLILSIAYRVDHSLSTNSIILMGVIFSMFASSLISLIIAFAGEKAKTVLFWTMGSLSAANFGQVLLASAVLLPGAAVLLGCGRELNAFAIGEENARHIGVNTGRIKLLILCASAVLIGTAVSVSGTIGFVGLVIPHMIRLICGPDHRHLLPLCLFAGANFLMLADLLSRVLLAPQELPIGVVTSLIGSAVFLCIFCRRRKVS